MKHPHLIEPFRPPQPIQPGLNRRQLLCALAATSWAASPSCGAALPQEESSKPEALKLTVLLEELPPYSFRDPEDRPRGYAFELAQSLLAHARIEAAYEFASWPRIMQRARKEPLILVPAMVRLPEREFQFFWPAQIAVRRGALYRLKSRPEIQVRKLDDVRAYRIGVVKDDVSERELLSLAPQLAPNLDRSADHASQLRRFFAERTELLALNQTLATSSLSQQGYDPGLIEPVLRFSDSRPFMALSLASGEALHLRLQKAWAEMRQDGSLALILKRYPMISLD